MAARAARARLGEDSCERVVDVEEEEDDWVG